MRIISGKYRGMKLNEFTVGGIRPTADRVKESVFNILGAKVADSRVLDLFCGSGNLGIECLSRGAAEVVFNDNSPASIAVLKGNIARIGEKNYKVYNLDYSLCLAKAGAFDLIFLDAPYASPAGYNALEIIGKSGLLKQDGIVIYERDRSFAGEIKGLELYDERKYGKTYISFFKAIKV